MSTSYMINFHQFQAAMILFIIYTCVVTSFVINFPQFQAAMILFIYTCVVTSYVINFHQFQAAMIGMGGTAIAQAITWATKTLTAAIVKEVANVPPPSR